VDTARLREIRPEKPVVGRLREVRSVTVASEVTGKIVSMNVREGSPVVGGKTVIASIDKVWLDLAVSKQEARIDMIEAQVGKEKDNLNRVKTLHKKGVATDSELTNQKADHDQRAAELRAARVELEDLKEQRKRIDITAPFDGWVTALRSELGQRLDVGSPVVDMVSRGSIYAETNVPESLVNGLKVGMKIPVRIEPIDETISGKITSITPYGSTASRTYPVRVELPDEDGKLKVGMSVTAIFPAGERQKRIMVSRDAVLVKPDGAVVWVVSRDKSPTAVPVPVDVLARQNNSLAVEALTDQGRKLMVDDAVVVIEGAERLRPGQPVRLMKEKAAPSLPRPD
jgi:RND family efflux transporter MFP subunit